MALSTARVLLEGKTAFAHEKEAIEFVKSELPDTGPYQMWALAELLDTSSGRLLELDLVVLGYRALYLVEIKSHPGRIGGDSVDWTWEPPDGGRRYLEPPLRLTNHKARVLKSRLQQKAQGGRIPWVQPLVFLSSPDLDLRVNAEGRTCVVTRQELRKALTHHEFPGASPVPAVAIDMPTMKRVAQAMRDIGLRPRKGLSHVGSYALGEVLEDGPGYQDREAIHRDNERMRARARTYLVPDGTTVERRQLLARAAKREANLLYDVREHPHVLHFQTFVDDAPVGPTLLLEDFGGGMPLPAFLRAHPELSFDDRIAILEQVGRALAFCHRRNVLHGALSPHAVLVRRRSAGEPIETRLYDFQLGESDEIEGTRHWSALASEPWTLYQAPELREDASRRSTTSDVYSLGAVAYYLLAGRPPAETVGDLILRLTADRKLDIRAVAGDRVPEKLADLIDLATDVSPIQRMDDAGMWVEEFVQAARARSDAPLATELDPLEANKDDLLGDFVVTRVLGQGATARVLEVASSRDTRSYALKVSLGPEHDERIEAEGRLLTRLNHPRIVKVVGEHRFHGRYALQMALAGEETLQRHLAKHGTIALEFASRYGEDLLSALEYLEDEGVVHRDIKPANLGVGSAQKAQHRLTLFDFSLVDAPVTLLEVGTSTYRDPFLALRGSWDPGADRWSAAVTLHEMLTGARPAYEGTALDAEAKLRLTPERFDASVRDALVTFFHRALDRDVERRFASAREMRIAWTHAFEAPKAVDHAASAVPPGAEPSVFDPDKVALDATLESLPLGARAKNALDRAGLRTVRDLFALPDNRLSAIRGVGREVAREVLELRDQIRGAQALAPAPVAAYAPEYRGPDTLLSALDLPRELVVALDEAGLASLGAVARSPESQVDALVARARASKKLLRAALANAERHALDHDRAATVEAWLAQMMQGTAAQKKHVGALLGLGAPFEGQVDVTARRVAQQAGTTDANIYLALSALRAHWSGHGSYPDLEALVATVVEVGGSAMALDAAARALLERLPSERPDADPLRLAGAAALVRIVTEVEKESPSSLRMIRLRNEQPWVVASQDHAEALRRLAEAADDLARREPIAGSGEARRVIEHAAAGTPFATLPAERLLELACRASEHAACSARLEVYPRGLPARTSIELSAPVLSGTLTPEEIVRRVSQRYPLAAPLPMRPELDALLAPLRLVFHEASGRYGREGDSHTTQLGTLFDTKRTRLSSVLSPHAHRPDAQAEAAEDFRLAMKASIEARSFRVLGVSVDRTEEAARTLVARFGLRRVSLDRVLSQAVRALEAKHGIDPAAVFAHDASGEHGPAWAGLCELMRDAARQALASLLPVQQPLLLTEPGLLARYRLDAFVHGLREAGLAPENEALFLLVPGSDAAGVPLVNGTYALPGVLPNHARRVPSAFLDRATQAA